MPRHYLINILFIPKSKSRLWWFDLVCIYDLRLVYLLEKSRDPRLLQIREFAFPQKTGIIPRVTSQSSKVVFKKDDSLN